jgi:hypothetical protein
MVCRARVTAPFAFFAAGHRRGMDKSGSPAQKTAEKAPIFYDACAFRRINACLHGN